MNTTYEVKSEDTLPVFEHTLNEDISGYSEVRLYVEYIGLNVLVVNDTMTVDDAGTGSVSYHFSGEQTSYNGIHYAEIVVRYPDDAVESDADTEQDVESYPKDGYFRFDFHETLDRSANLGTIADPDAEVAHLTVTGNAVFEQDVTVHGNLDVPSVTTETIVDADTDTVYDVGDDLAGGGGGGSGGETWSQTTVTSDYVAGDGDSVWADSSSQAVDVSVPPPEQGVLVRVVAVDASNGVAVSENGSEQINDGSGGQSQLSLTDGESVTLESDGTTYWVI